MFKELDKLQQVPQDYNIRIVLTCNTRSVCFQICKVATATLTCVVYTR
jgi:hypothetical protein